MYSKVVYIVYSVSLCVIFVVFLQNIRKQGDRMTRMKQLCKRCIQQGPKSIESFEDVGMIMFDSTNEIVDFVTENAMEISDDLISISNEIPSTHTFHFKHFPDLPNVSHTICMVKETKSNIVCVGFINL